MASTFICPNCGRQGHISKGIPLNAKLRCPGCQRLFSPTFALEPALVGKVSEDQIDQYLGMDSNGLSPPDLPLEDQQATETVNVHQLSTLDLDGIQPQQSVNSSAVRLPFIPEEPWFYAHLWGYGSSIKKMG